MQVLCSNQTGEVHGYLCGRFEGSIGHLFSTDGRFGPFPFAPYALDNGAFPAWIKNQEWDESAWLRLIDAAAVCPHQPKWALVPDVVADRERTIERWHQYIQQVRDRGLIPAFAVQDGMTPIDVPADAQVIFIGGSTEWKWQTMSDWCRHFSRVHVGRVNTYGKLRLCYESGAESTDGTGWFRGDKEQFAGLVRFLEETAGNSIREHSADLAWKANAPRSLLKFNPADFAGRQDQQLRMF